MKKILLFFMLLLTFVPTSSFADTATSTATVGFYIADEDKGVQFITNNENSYIKNFELYKIKITEKTKDSIKEYSFTEDDGMEIPFKFKNNAKYETTIMFVP